MVVYLFTKSPETDKAPIEAIIPSAASMPVCLRHRQATIPNPKSPFRSTIGKGFGQDGRFFNQREPASPVIDGKLMQRSLLSSFCIIRLFLTFKLSYSDVNSTGGTEQVRNSGLNPSLLNSEMGELNAWCELYNK